MTSLYHTPEFELPEYAEPCPHDAVSLIEEYHAGLHTVLISKQDRKRSYKPIAKVICQEGGDKRSPPVANPDDIAEYIMAIIQWDIDRTDDPGKYRMTVVGPPGKGRFEYAKHIDMTATDGVPRTMNLVNEGDLHEMMSAYVGELHQQNLTMMEMVTNSHAVLVNENREMMKIVSEALRKNGEMERSRWEHQLNLRMLEEDQKFREAEAERNTQKWKEGFEVIKKTGAAEEVMRAVARKIDQFGPKDEPELPEIGGAKVDPEKAEDGEAVGEDGKKESDPKKKPSAKKKSASKKASKKSAAKKKSRVVKRATPEKSEEDMSDEEIEASVAKLARERPLVMAAEALKMSIDTNRQWSIIRRTLSEEQADLLDDIFAAASDKEVVAAASALYGAKGLNELTELGGHLDEQQQRFIEFILRHVEK